MLLQLTVSSETGLASAGVSGKAAATGTVGTPRPLVVTGEVAEEKHIRRGDQVERTHQPDTNDNVGS